MRIYYSLALIAIFLCSCGGNELPMTRNQIYDARVSVDTLFITEEGKESVAPGNKVGVTVDPDTGKLGWAAWKCDNPDCPEKASAETGERPFVFIWPNFLAYVAEDGTVAFGQPLSEDDFKQFEEFAEPKCPACLTIRNLTKESPDERLQYQNWCGKYVLPQAEARLKELDEEYARYLEREKQRSGQ